MKLNQLFEVIQNITIKHGLSKPYIVGGTPRDKVLNKLESISDIDLTTGDQSVFILAKETAHVLSKYIDFFKVMNDKHASMKIGTLKVDFSNNFEIQGIDRILQGKNIKQTPIIQELYSRDFFCNTLLWTLDLKEIIDLSNKGLNNIQNKLIQTCLDPQITFHSDPKRIIRAIYLASKLDFDIEINTANWIVSNPQYLKVVDNNYIIKKTIKALKYNKNKTIQLIKQLNLSKYIPSSEGLSSEIGGII